MPTLGCDCCSGISPNGQFCFLCFKRPSRALFHLFHGRRGTRPRSPHCDAAVVRFARPPAASAILLPAEVRKKRDATMSPKATLLIVDDEPDVREVLEEYFVAHGYAAIGAESAAAAQAMAAEHCDRPGAGRHQHARRGWLEPCAPSARALRQDRDRHADFRRHGRGSDRGPRDGRRRLRPQTLRPARAGGARARACCAARRPRGRADIGAERVRIGRCVLDLAAHRLTDDTGEEVAMSPLEFDLLKALAEHPNRALSRERILNLQPASAIGTHSTAAWICASCGCARRSSPIPSIRGTSGPYATRATSSYRTEA